MAEHFTPILPQEKGFWWDAHCHLVEWASDCQLKEALERSSQAKVQGWVLAGTHPRDFVRQQQLQSQYPERIIISLGLHPWWISQNATQEIDRALVAFRETAQRHAQRVQCIGEIGLDFSPKWKNPTIKQLQISYFRKILQIVKPLDVPLALHVVKAHAEVLSLLAEFGPFHRGGLVHGFSGSLELALEYVKHGFHISIGKGLLKPGYLGLKRAAVALPLSSILIETDSDEPADLILVGAELARLRNISPDEVREKTSLNLSRLFEINPAHSNSLKG